MFTVLKQGSVIYACRLGEPSPLLERLLREGKIVPAGKDRYEVYSVETDGNHGEVAFTGDFVKLDANGNVYPNAASYFLERHTKTSENLYLQKPQRLPAWDAQEPMCDEIVFLMEEKGLVIDRQSRDRYYSALLWGTMLYAARDAVILFYSVSRDEKGRITDAEFNFVEHTVFLKTYERI